MTELAGKAAFVTGAGTGMGRAAALALARAGAAVFLVGRRVKPLDAVRREIEALGGTATIYSADVLRREEVKAAIDHMVAHFGPIDLAFNNAGGHADFKPIDETPEAEAEWVIDLNFKAVYWCVKYQIERMRAQGGGSIVNNASVFGLKAMPGIAHYVASKFAVVGLTRSVAI